jgi:hypothetical protein
MSEPQHQGFLWRANPGPRGHWPLTGRWFASSLDAARRIYCALRCVADFYPPAQVDAAGQREKHAFLAQPGDTVPPGFAPSRNSGD